MGLSSLIRERRPVDLAGRRFIVRAPTVGTVHVLCERFPGEIAALRAGWSAVIAGREHLTPTLMLPLFLARPADLAAVLGTCVDTDEPREGWPLRPLALAVLGLCDPGRIAAAIEPDSENDDAPSEPVRASESIAKLARAFRCSPFDVMDWPYEGYLELVQAGSAERQESALAGKGFTPEFIRACRAKAAGTLH